jgi:hypothetical protein
MNSGFLTNMVKSLECYVTFTSKNVFQNQHLTVQKNNLKTFVRSISTM